jgi:hypothetical protein
MEIIWKFYWERIKGDMWDFKRRVGDFMGFSEFNEFTAA